VLRFVKGAVAAREYAKLQFSRVVSELLRELRLLGEEVGLDPDDMSYVTIECLRSVQRRPGDSKAHLLEAEGAGRHRHAVTETLFAPTVLSDPLEFVSFAAVEERPTFVTRSRVMARRAVVDEDVSLHGAIAMITAADPGYDWVFTHNIAGLVTAFGGSNSHMAIRARELAVPAAIGVGEDKFARLREAPALEIDTQSQSVRPVVLHKADLT
jgi:phosphohistidine swiveling domain-containing protein